METRGENWFDGLVPLPTAEEMYSFDKAAIKSCADESALMRKAGAALCKELLFRTNLRTFIIFIGPGNNGGDGLVVARLLLERGYSVRVLASSSSRFSDLWKLMASEFIEAGGNIESFESEASKFPCPVSVFQGAGKERICRVDALLGIGQTSKPRSSLLRCCAALTQFTGPVISLDVPTGLNVDTGEVYPGGVQADITLTVEYVKRGMLQLPAKERIGSLVVVPVGIPAVSATQASYVPPHVINSLVNIPSPDSHKGTFGHLGIFAGSENMPGAAALCAAGALASGSGKITVHSAVAGNWSLAPEVMRKEIRLDSASEDFDLAGFQGVLIGPGLGRSAEVKVFVARLLVQAANLNLPTVIDADGLYSLSLLKDSTLPNHTFLTPHPGEAAALLGSSTTEVQRNRFATALELSARYKGATVILKGHGTIIAHDSQLYLCREAKPNLATAGTGDVLAGLLAGLLTRGYSDLEAAVLALHLHSSASAELWSQSFSPAKASDFITEVATVWNKILK